MNCMQNKILKKIIYPYNSNGDKSKTEVTIEAINFGLSESSLPLPFEATSSFS